MKQNKQINLQALNQPRRSFQYTEKPLDEKQKVTFAKPPGTRRFSLDELSCYRLCLFWLYSVQFVCLSQIQ